eukprot:COSAG01_NODE_463_length_16671_cov_192.938209_12_plen_92_part_00
MLSVASRLQKLLNEHIKPMACCSNDDDAITVLMGASEIRAVFFDHRDKLEKVRCVSVDLSGHDLPPVSCSRTPAWWVADNAFDHAFCAPGI